MNVLATARLSLRELRLEDDGFILELLNEPAFLRHIGDKGVRDASAARSYLVAGPLASYARHGFGLYLTSLASSGEPVGICGLLKRDDLPDVDLGFAFLARHGARGYARESAAAVLEFGRRRLGLERIVAITAPDNSGSIAVLEKVGLRFERMIEIGPEAKSLKLFGPAWNGRFPPIDGNGPE